MFEYWLTHNDHGRLGSLLDGAHSIEHRFNIITEGCPTRYLQKMRSELLNMDGDEVNDAWIENLENVTCEVSSLLRSVVEHSHGILQESGCSDKWREVEKVVVVIRTVLRGLEEMVCDVM